MIQYKIDIMEALQRIGITSTTCKQDKIFSQSIYTRLKRGELVGLDTINRLCCILEMQPRDLIRYVETPEDTELYMTAHKKIENVSYKPLTVTKNGDMLKPQREERRTLIGREKRMKKQYTTNFYETNAGYIYAVAFENGKVTNIISCVDSNGELTGSKALEAAREGWPYADAFNPDDWSGLSMEQAAEELEKETETPAGEERVTDLIAEVKPTPAYVKGLPFATFYWDRMGYAGLELFKDLDKPEAIAYRIKTSDEWFAEDCEKLIKEANMWDEYQKAREEIEENGGNFDTEAFMARVAEKLGVDIG